jgi:hypothetical protein
MSNLISSKVERDRVRTEKERKILFFLLEERFSITPVLAQLLKMTPNGTQRILNRMEAQEMIKAHTIDFELSAWSQKIWGLTPKGLLLVNDKNESIKFFEVGRIKPITMMHSLALQRAKAIALGCGWNNWISSTKMLQSANLSRTTWMQVPDAVAMSPKRRKIAIELERTVKTPKRYVEILANYAEMLSSGIIVEVIYICPENIAKRLERLFFRIEKIIFKGKVMLVHASLLKRFYFLTYEEWEVQAKDF